MHNNLLRTPSGRIEGDDIFRQTIPGLELSIEKATDNVPADGRFYVIDRGVIHRGYKTLKQATAAYSQIRAGRQASAPPPAISPMQASE